MEFCLTDDQLELTAVVRDVLTAECPPESLLVTWGSEDGRAGVWPVLAELGLAGLAAPEDLGGLGLDEVALVGPILETGRACLAEPVVETACVAVPLLVALDDGRIAPLLAGSTAAVLDGGFGAWVDSASIVVAVDADTVRIADRGSVEVTSRLSTDRTRPVSQVVCVDADVTIHRDSALVERVRDRAAFGASAQLLGLATWMLDATVAYAGAREQFSRPIGSFQAVKHHLANARIALEFARPLVHRAAWSLANDIPDAAVYVSMAKAKAGEAADLCARVALQVHGAIGYSTEYPLHVYMKRVWALDRTWGTRSDHLEKVAQAAARGLDILATG